MERPSRDELFLRMCVLVGERGTCLRAQVGAIIEREGRVIAMGYNGAPPGLPHCTDVGCWAPVGEADRMVPHVSWDRATLLEAERNAALVRQGCQRAVHAEANAIAFAARHGVPTFGATMYCTYSPCQKCAELILSAGIGRFVYAKSYRAERLDLLQTIEVIQIAAEQQGEHKRNSGEGVSRRDTEVFGEVGLQGRGSFPRGHTPSLEE